MKRLRGCTDCDAAIAAAAAVAAVYTHMYRDINVCMLLPREETIDKGKLTTTVNAYWEFNEPGTRLVIVYDPQRNDKHNPFEYHAIQCLR